MRGWTRNRIRGELDLEPQEDKPSIKLRIEIIMGMDIGRGLLVDVSIGLLCHGT